MLDPWPYRIEAVLPAGEDDPAGTRAFVELELELDDPSHEWDYIVTTEDQRRGWVLVVQCASPARCAHARRVLDRMVPA